MNQDSSFPPMLPPSGELSALLFALLPCLQETYRPLASFAYHMTELTKMRTLPSVPSLTGLSGIDALIADKDIMLYSLSFYGKMFRMPLLSTIASLLQGMQFYQSYKEILPGLFSGMGNSGTDSSSAFGSMAGLFSGLGNFGNNSAAESSTPDLLSLLGMLSPDILSGLFSGFPGGSTPNSTSSDPSPSPDNSSAQTTADVSEPPVTETVTPEFQTTTEEFVSVEPAPSSSDKDSSDTLFESLHTLLTPEQQKIYEQLMHTD